jgi:hypothetical protein
MSGGRGSWNRDEGGNRCGNGNDSRRSRVIPRQNLGNNALHEIGQE